MRSRSWLLCGLLCWAACSSSDGSSDGEGDSGARDAGETRDARAPGETGDGSVDAGDAARPGSDGGDRDGSLEDGGDTSTPRGALAVMISAPDGVAADVDVEGPDGYARTLSETTMLEDLVPGDYTVTPGPVRKPGAVVDELYVAESARVEVAADESQTASVTYALRPGTGRMWLPVAGSTKVNGYGPAELAAGGDGVTPGLAIGVGTGNFPWSAAIGSDGTLWLGTQGGQLFGFAASQLAVSGTPAPHVEIETGSTDISSLAFDREGSLWMTAAGDLRKLTASQLAESGSPPADVIITGDVDHPLMYPRALAFDTAGALWVTAGNAIYAYLPEQLASTSEQAPSIVISDNAGSLSTPRGLAFDATGALWVANWGASSVVKFAPSQIESSGAPTPSITLMGFPQPLQLAFDAGGNLWVSSSWALGMASSGGLAQVAAANLVASASPAHAVDFGDIGGFDAGGGIAFNPPPLGLPLSQ